MVAGRIPLAVVSAWRGPGQKCHPVGQAMVRAIRLSVAEDPAEVAEFRLRLNAKELNACACSKQKRSPPRGRPRRSDWMPMTAPPGQAVFTSAAAIHFPSTVRTIWLSRRDCRLSCRITSTGSATSQGPLGPFWATPRALSASARTVSYPQRYWFCRMLE